MRTTKGGVLPAGEVLAAVEALLDRVDPDRSGSGAADRLAWVRAARRVRGRVESLAAVLTAEADRARASEVAAGTPMASWLGMGEVVSRREAAGVLRQARSLGEHPLVGEAALSGALVPGQARVITGVLDGLASQLDAAEQARAEQVLVGLASQLDADQLARSAGRVLAEVAPARADELLAESLQRQAEAAHRQRALRFFREGGSVRFDGSLPKVAGEKWIAQLDAMGEAARRTAIERRDPLATRPTPEQRRVDALIALIEQGAGQPGAGGSTARVLVTLSYDQLMAGSAAAGLLGDGSPVSAGELRRLCCDAELIPVVLGAPSAVLDVGRATRVVSPELRAALVARDGGCVFPGCDAPPTLCEAHHVVPWHLGGPTALRNLVLLCHSHHPVVEPARYGIRDQWEVRIAADGYPEHLPPARVDPARTPIRHQRHQPHQGVTARSTGPPAVA